MNFTEVLKSRQRACADFFTPSMHAARTAARATIERAIATNEYTAKLARVLPPEMLAAKQWMVGQRKWKDGKLGMIPQASGHDADWTDPARWKNFEQAAFSYAMQAGDFPEGGGLQFILPADRSITCIDLDRCRNSLTGEVYAHMAAWSEAARQAGTYDEISNSGNGDHIIGFAQKPGDRIRSSKHPGIELFDSPKPIFITGNVAPGSKSGRQRLADIQELVDGLYGRMFPAGEDYDHEGGVVHGEGCECAVCVPRKATGFPGVAAMLEKISSSGMKKEMKDRVEKFFRLWAGDMSDFGGNHSSADLSLCNTLAFWVNYDAELLEAVFAESGLCRGKWLDRADYREGTIRRVLAGKTGTGYDWSRHSPKPVACKGDSCKCPDLGERKTHSPRSGHFDPPPLTPSQVSALTQYYADAATVAAGGHVHPSPENDSRLLPELVTRTVLRPTGETKLVVVRGQTVKRPVLAGVVESIEGQYATRIDSDWGDCRRVPSLFFQPSNPSKHACICYACQNRSCPDCGHIWLRDNSIHFTKTIGQWAPIWMYTADDSETEKIKKRVARTNLPDECRQNQPLHVNVPLANGKRLWFTNVPAKGFIQVSQDTADKLLIDAIEGMTERLESRDIGKSRGLELRKPKAPPTGKWRPVPQQGKRAIVSFSAVRAAIEDFAGVERDRDWFQFGQRWLFYQDDPEHALSYRILEAVKPEYMASGEVIRRGPVTIKTAKPASERRSFVLGRMRERANK